MKQGMLLGSTAVLAVLAGSGAFAQVTPEEVWQNWQDMSSSYGQTVTAASTAREGDTLVVSGVTIKMADPTSTVEATIETLNFTDKGDGSVEVTMSDSMPLKITAPGTDGAAESVVSMTVSMPGMAMVAGGSADATSYNWNAPTIGVKLDGIEGPDAETLTMTAEATITGSTGNYLIEGAAGAQKMTSAFTADGAVLNLAANDTADATDVKITANLSALTGTSSGNLLGMEAMADMAAALRAGFATEAAVNWGTVSYDFAVTEASGPTTIKGGSQGGGFTFALGAGGVSFGGGGKGVEFAISAPDIPFPEVKLGYAESAFSFMMPLVASDTPSDFALLAKVVDLAISDDIWGMIDPGAQLPHDPASVTLDTKGTARLTTDLANEAAMEALGDAPPGELHSFDLTELLLRVAGAELTGSGAFTFDNTDLVTFGGMPAPSGKIDLKLLGGTKLIDTLIAMGLMSEEDASGARMMLAMFANPGAGEDEFTSTIEVKDKQLLVNGMPMPM